MTPEMRSVDHPSMLKDGIGWGAMAGMAAVELAGRGFSGIPSLFDAGPLARAQVGTLGQDFLITRLYFKPYACCRWAQPAVEGALEAGRRLGAAASEVARVRVHTFEAALHLRPAAPRTTEEAQFSLPWPVAAALLDGAVGPAQVLGEALADPARRALAARVELVLDHALEAAFPTRALAWVELETFDGRRARSEVVAARGDADATPSAAESGAKFRGLVAPLLGPACAAELEDAICSLDCSEELGPLSRLLRLPLE